MNCPVCLKELKNEAGLAGHMRLAHSGGARVDGAQLGAQLQELKELFIGFGERLEGIEQRFCELPRSSTLY